MYFRALTRGIFGDSFSDLDIRNTLTKKYDKNPKVLLNDKDNLHKEVIKYLQIFKDHPYVFNLGHGILPETKIEMVEELVKIVRDFK